MIDSEDIIAEGGAVLDIGRRIMAEAARGSRSTQIGRLTHELSCAAGRLAAIAAAARQSGDVKQAPGEAPQSGHEVASPEGGSHA